MCHVYYSRSASVPLFKFSVAPAFYSCLCIPCNLKNICSPLIQILSSPPCYSRLVKFSVATVFPQTQPPLTHTHTTLETIGRSPPSLAPPSSTSACAPGSLSSQCPKRGLSRPFRPMPTRWPPRCPRRPPWARSARRPAPTPVRGLPHPPPDPAANEVLP